MSDTPRSNDAGKVVIPSGGGVRMVNPELGEKPWVVPFTFAQELERENAALREAGHLAEKIIVQRTDEIRHLERENAALRASEESLASTVRGLEFELEKAQAENAALRADNETLRAILACYRG